MFRSLFRPTPPIHPIPDPRTSPDLQPSPSPIRRLLRLPRRRPARILLALALGLASLAGGILTARAQQPVLEWHTPLADAAEVWAGHRIILQFREPMNRASVEAGLSIEPPMPGRFFWSDDAYVQYIPDDPHAPGASHAVTLATSVRTRRGTPAFTSPYRWTFTVASRAILPNFNHSGLPVQQITPSGGRGIPFQPGYPMGSFRFTLYRIDPDAFVRRYLALTPRVRNTIDFAGLPVAATWQKSLDALSAPVMVAMPAGLAPGLYVLDARHPNTGSAQTLVMHSDYALVARTERRGTAFWSSRLPSGAPGPEPEVTLYGADGRVLARAEGDAAGVTRFDLPTGNPDGARVALAQVAGHPAMVGLDGWWNSSQGTSSYIWQDPGPQPPAFAAHIHTDRPIYRPGHTVYYKATLRDLASDRPALIAPGTPVSVTVKDAGGNVITRASPASDAFGTVAGELRLGDEVALGNWAIELNLAGQLHRGQFKVEEYVKPDYEVKVLPDKPFYVRGQSATVKVQADYYFGQPVAGGEVVLRAYRRSYSYYSRSNPEFERRGTLSPEGGFEASFPLALNGDYSQTYTFEAEVVDASRRPVFGRSDASIHPADFNLGLGNRRYGVPEGQPIELDVSTMGHDGRPAGGRRVDIEIQSYDYRSGGYRPVQRESVTTGADGRVTARIPNIGYGWYSIRATARDDGGRIATATSYAWLYSNRYRWYWNQGLDVQADQTSYEAGDTARLLIRSPITGTALVMLERGDVYDELLVPVSGATPVEVPIKPEYAPSVDAKVLIWQPHDYQSTYAATGAEGYLLMASTTLVVPALDRRLEVEVVPDQAIRGPGETATFTLRVRDAAGRPARAQVALAVVDKAVLALADDTAGDIHYAFWRPRLSTVGSHDSVRPSHWYAYREYDRSARSYAGGPGMPGTPSPSATGTAPAASPTAAAPGAPDMGLDEAEVVPAPRREFRDTAYWHAAIETDAQGEAQVSFTLPDNLTTWVARARAVTVDTAAGEGLGEMVVTKPIIADPALPRFAVQGDQFVLDVLSRNYTAGSQPGTCSLEAPGLVVLDKGERGLDLPFNETKVARWSVVASSLGVNTVKARLVTPAGEDGIELPFEVHPFGVPERFAVAGSTRDLAIETFSLPYKFVPKDARVEIRLTPSIASSIFGGAEELIGFPYGCVEQTMSRVLPNAVIGRLQAEVGLERPEALAELPAMMDLGRQKLYGFQHQDGSWGWWTGGQNLYMSAYVLQGLDLVQQAGFEVDAGVLNRGYSYLSRTAPSSPEPRMQAYAAYVLAEAGRADQAFVESLLERRAELDAFATAALAMALDEVGRRDLAEPVFADLLAMVSEEGGDAHWTMDRANEFGSWSWQAMASDETSTAMALLAMSRFDPDHRLGAKAVNWLLYQRTGRGWRTTQSTAFALLGLTDYVIASGDLNPSYDYAVQLDDRILARGSVGGAGRKDIPPVILAGSDLTPGEHTVAIQVVGEGRLYYTIHGQMTLFYDRFQPTQAAGTGIDLRREYLPIDAAAGPGGWRAGDLVNVRLTLRTARNLHYVLVEDKLPAGFEALNQGLKTETAFPPGQEPPWRWWGYERKEVHDERVTFFDSQLPAGTHVFEYAARAVTPGIFSARPAEAYPMYRPEIWGRSASDQVRVDSGLVAERPDLGGDLDRDCRLTDFDAALIADAWGAGAPDAATGRDLNGDGRIDVADIALAGGRSGLECGDAVPLPPGAAAEMLLRLRAPEDLAQHQAFTLEILAEPLAGAALDLAAWEATLELPAGAFAVDGLAAGADFEGLRLLGPSLESQGTRLRLGGFRPEVLTVDGAKVLARLELRALRAGALDIGVHAAQAHDGRGASHHVSAGGLVVSPEPWQPRGWAFLPNAVRGVPVR